MKRITLFLLFIGYYLCLPATNYFVATNGNDSNSGTIDKPFATLGKAQSKVVPGDTVYIRQGTYKVSETEIMEHYTAGSTTWSRVFKMSNSPNVFVMKAEAIIFMSICRCMTAWLSVFI